MAPRGPPGFGLPVALLVLGLLLLLPSARGGPWSTSRARPEARRRGPEEHAVGKTSKVKSIQPSQPSPGSQRKGLQACTQRRSLDSDYNGSMDTTDGARGGPWSTSRARPEAKLGRRGPEEHAVGKTSTVKSSQPSQPSLGSEGKGLQSCTQRRSFDGDYNGLMDASDGARGGPWSTSRAMPEARLGRRGPEAHAVGTTSTVKSSQPSQPSLGSQRKEMRSRGQQEAGDPTQKDVPSVLPALRALEWTSLDKTGPSRGETEGVKSANKTALEHAVAASKLELGVETGPWSSRGLAWATRRRRPPQPRKGQGMIGRGGWGAKGKGVRMRKTHRELGVDSHSHPWLQSCTQRRSLDGDYNGLMNATDANALLQAAKVMGLDTAEVGWSKSSPCSAWSGVTCEPANGRVMSLDLFHRVLSGSIPATLGSLIELADLNLGYTGLSGSIPESLGSLKNLGSLELSYNQLSGSIPASLGSLIELAGLSLGRNQLSGSIPASLGSLKNLTYLDLRMNKLTGPIPASLGSLKHLQWLDLQNNQLSGYIPESLGSLIELVELDLAGNQVSGSIPASLGSMKKLTTLSLSSNQLSGPIPESLSSLIELTYLDLPDNRLSGSIPASLGSLKHLQRLGLSENQLSGSFPESLGSLDELTSLYLDGNQLTGYIPSSLGSFENLRFLVVHDNYFTSGCTIVEDKNDDPSVNCFMDCKSRAIQRLPTECDALCHAQRPSGACSGQGICSLADSPTGYGICTCFPGYNTKVDDYGDCVWNSSGEASGFQGFPEVNNSAPHLTGVGFGAHVSIANFTFLNAFSRYLTSNFYVSNYNPGYFLLSGVFWQADALLFKNHRGPGSPAPNGVLIWRHPRNQGNCSACWAQAAVDAASAAAVIARNPVKAKVPQLSTEQVVYCSTASLNSSCSPNFPSNALDYLSQQRIHTRKNPDFHIRTPASPQLHCPLKQKRKRPLVAMYEQVRYRGWFGVLLVIMHQPAIVTLDGSYKYFQQPDAICKIRKYVFSDPRCFQEITHSVVVLGHDLYDDNPYWVIRNSWGSSWCQGGYMRIKIAPGEGTCGMHVLPAYYPIPMPAKGDPCYAKAMQPDISDDRFYRFGPLQPCGRGTCTPKPEWGRLGYSCDCSRIDPTGTFKFVNVNNTVLLPDGSITQTCVPVDVCESTGFNPCFVGTCVNDGKGNYSCICPLGWTNNTDASGRPVCSFFASHRTQAMYTVQEGATCAHIAAAYFISVEELMNQNPGLGCPLPPVSTQVHLKDLTFKCKTIYNIQPSDETCQDVVDKITPSQGNPPLDVADIQNLNPYLNCKNLQGSTMVCLQAGEWEDTSYCAVPQPIAPASSCPDLLQQYWGGENDKPLDMFRLNPSLLCDSLTPPVSTQDSLKSEASVCTRESSAYSGQGSCDGVCYKVLKCKNCCALAHTRSRETCTSLLRPYKFSSYKQIADLTTLNCGPGYSKTNALPANMGFCHPK